MSQWWNTGFDLTGLRFETQTSRSRDERVTTQPTGISSFKIPMQLSFYFQKEIYPTMNASKQEALTKPITVLVIFVQHTSRLSTESEASMNYAENED